MWAARSVSQQKFPKNYKTITCIVYLFFHTNFRLSILLNMICILSVSKREIKPYLYRLFFVMIWTVHALSFLEPQDGERGSIKRQCMASASIHHLPKDFGSTFCIVIFWGKNVDIMINIITIYFLYKKTNMSFFIFFFNKSTILPIHCTCNIIFLKIVFYIRKLLIFNCSLPFNYKLKMVNSHNWYRLNVL